MTKQSVSYFFDQLTSDYTAAIERCFPRYREMLWAVLDYLPNQSFCSVLELGCGTGNLSVLLADKFPDASIHMVDLSHDSLQACQQRMGDDSRFVFQQSDFADLQFNSAHFDLITSSISIHHLTTEQKATLLDKAYQWLKPGGVIAFADQFRGETDDLYSRHMANWETLSLSAGATEDEFAMWQQHQLEHDHHDTLSQHLNWLAHSGFDSVDCVWRYLLWAVVQARKPVTCLS